jgi:hypothetical protein
MIRIMITPLQTFEFQAQSELTDAVVHVDWSLFKENVGIFKYYEY